MMAAFFGPYQMAFQSQPAEPAGRLSLVANVIKRIPPKPE
jgi:hypothetical protein